MKSIFGFFVFVLISTKATSSKPLLDNDSKSFSISHEDLESIKKYVDSEIEIINNNLTTIKTDLIEKKQEKEAEEVEKIRNVLISSSREKCNEAINFLIKYEKYFVTEDSSYASSNVKYSKISIGLNGERVFFLFTTGRLSFLLKRVQIGLARDDLIGETDVARKLRMAMKTEVDLIIDQSYDFIEKYLPQQKPLVPADPKEAKKEEQNFVKAIGDEIVKYLIKVQGGLFKDEKTVESLEVGTTLRFLNSPEFAKFHLEALDFMYENTKYWIPPSSSELKSNLEFSISELFLFDFKCQILALRECEKGLIKDKKEDEAKKAQNFKEGLENQTIPAYEDSFFFLEFYSKYL